MWWMIFFRLYSGAFKSRSAILPALFISLLTSKLWSDVISFAGTPKAQREKFALSMGTARKASTSAVLFLAVAE